MKGKFMEPADFAVKIEEIMAEVTSGYECVMLDENDIGMLWTFVIEDSISGYIGIEENDEGLNVKTVSVGLHLKDITDVSKEELMALFELNGELINANFSVVKYPSSDSNKSKEPVFIEEGEDFDYEDDDTPPELRDLLIIQSRLPYEAFLPEDFEAFVNNLMFQADMLLNNPDEDSSDETMEII
ncbi:MAG: hypothetical protein PHF29_00130 [Candidatus Riflebacteria bacterium]|nr:hypothetical protein [Candidatus Riflebacteria bacterium]